MAAFAFSRKAAIDLHRRISMRSEQSEGHELRPVAGWPASGGGLRLWNPWWSPLSSWTPDPGYSTRSPPAKLSDIIVLFQVFRVIHEGGLPKNRSTLANAPRLRPLVYG